MKQPQYEQLAETFKPIANKLVKLIISKNVDKAVNEGNQSPTTNQLPVGEGDGGDVTNSDSLVDTFIKFHPRAELFNDYEERKLGLEVTSMI